MEGKERAKEQHLILNVEGGSPLRGEVSLQGSKNAALPILAACLLIPGETLLHNVPQIQDTENMKGLLQCVGAKADGARDVLVDAGNLQLSHLPQDKVSSMRSSVLLLGPLLARLGEIRIGYPGGCIIGKRPIDLHLWAMEKLGASVEFEPDGIRIFASKLNGCVLHFPFPSVGATENSILAAMGAQGDTVIVNAAREPEVTALCRFLVSAGAAIDGIGTGRLRIHPGRLHPVSFSIPSDRIVAGTYMMAIAGAGGEGLLKQVPLQEIECVRQVLSTMGVGFQENGKDLCVKRLGALGPVPFVATDHYPGFPTDLQPMLLAVLMKAEGCSELQEQIFEDRFGYVKELQKMGARITLKENLAAVAPSEAVLPARLTAGDLRGGAALVVAALMASGTSRISGTAYIRRGYEDIVRDIRLLGGKISEEIEEPEI